MKDQIQDIIERFGPRAAGSDAEKKAQEYIATLMQTITTNVVTEPFKAELTAKFGKFRYYCIGYILSLLLFFIFFPAALIVSLVNATVLVCDMMRNEGIADFLFQKQTSWNVTATLEPQQEVKSTLIFSGHIDSTNECTWWYRLKKYGGHVTIFAGLLIVLLPLFYIGLFILRTLFLDEFLDVVRIIYWSYFFFVLFSPVTLIFFSFHGDMVVDGACDNLSGVILCRNIVSFFADPLNSGLSILKNTRLRFISFGAEERGLRGSKAFIAAHEEHLKAENAHLINIDSIRLPDEITILSGELMSFVAFDKPLIARVERAFQNANINFKKRWLPMGGTDAIPFQQRGIPALTIIGMNTKSLDPTYHTRLDTIENVDQMALDNTKAAMIELVKQWDNTPSNAL
jgi:hypothetical protein